MCRCVLTFGKETKDRGTSLQVLDSRDRIVVSTSRCGRDNPGSNPGHGKMIFFWCDLSNIHFVVLIFS